MTSSLQRNCFHLELITASVSHKPQALNRLNRSMPISGYKVSCTAPKHNGHIHCINIQPMCRWSYFSCQIRAAMPPNRDPLDVLIVSAGAVGTLFASCIHKNPNIRLTVLCRSNHEQVKKHGLEIFQRRTSPVIIRPQNVVPSLLSLGKEASFQYVVCANKVTRSSNDYL